MVSTLDFISNLPDHIIDNILTCLPIEYAARTSILSKNWRFKWISISQLVFDPCGNFMARKTQSQKWCQIFQILFIHQGPLNTFVLRATSCRGAISFSVDRIIGFLTRKNIQKLTIHGPFGSYYKLPATIFQCIHLTHLDLSFCSWRLPPEFIGFSRLVSVKLARVDISADDFKTFISKCPHLQRLTLELMYNGPPLEINAPNLKHMWLAYARRSIIFKNVPLLSSLIITSSTMWLGKFVDVTKLFGSLPAIEYINVGCCLFMDTLTYVVPERLPVMLNNLIFVALGGFQFSSLKAVQFALLLITSSPNLQKLKIQGAMYEFGKPLDVASMVQLRNTLGRVEESFNKLQEVRVEEFNGEAPVLEFLKFILEKSLVLKILTIQTCRRISADKRQKIAIDVTQIQRASPEAEIICISA